MCGFKGIQGKFPSKEETRVAPELVQRVQELILEDLGTSIRKLAAVLKESIQTSVDGLLKKFEIYLRTYDVYLKSSYTTIRRSSYR